MKVLLVVPRFPQLSETFIVNKFLGLLERGCDIHVVSDRSEREEWNRFSQLHGQPQLRNRVHTSWPLRPRWLAAFLLPGLLVWCFLRRPLITSRYLMRGWFLFGINVVRRFYLDVEIILCQPDLIHFEFGTSGVGRMYLGDLLGCKIVASFRGHDLNFVGLDDPNYFDEVWNHVDGIHCLGADLLKRAQLRGCPPNVLTSLIPPAINTGFFNVAERIPLEVGIPERPLRLLSVARLYWTKGYEYALQAIELIRKRGITVEYRIVGAGEYLEAIEYCRYQLGLEDTISILGAMPPEEVRKQMEWADIFIHPAVSEGFCNAVIEAQAMQLPVVCTDADGLAENVQNGVTGYVVARRDAAALADKIFVLAMDPELRERMGRAGCRRVERHFRLADQITAFEELYSQVMSSQERLGDSTVTAATLPVRW